jgi:hypothetical protein
MRRLNYQLRRGLNLPSCVNIVNYGLVGAKWLSADSTCMRTYMRSEKVDGELLLGLLESCFWESERMSFLQ